MGGVAYENGITVEEAATEVGTGLACFTIAEAMGLFGNVSSKASALIFTLSSHRILSIFFNPSPNDVSLGEKRNECFILRHAVHSWIGAMTVLDFYSFVQLLASCFSYIPNPQQYSFRIRPMPALKRLWLLLKQHCTARATSRLSGRSL